MESLVIAVCDDDTRQISLVKNYLLALCEDLGRKVDVFDYDQGEKLLLEVGEIKPDIIFLDIQMAAMDGIETARNIREIDRDVVIIFISAFSDYVFDSFEVRPFNYLVKPIDKTIFNVICGKAVQEAESHKKKKITFIYIKIGGESIKFKTEDIYYFESELRKVRLISKEGVIKFVAKMSNLEKELAEDGFLRCHQGFLVNLNNVKAIRGDMVEMENGDKIPIGRTKREETRSAFFESVRMVKL